MSRNVHNSLNKGANFGSTIQQIRKQKNLRQEDVAGTIPLSTYRKIEYNSLKPNIDNFLSILEKLEISVTEFMYIHEKDSRITKDDLLFSFKEVLHNLNKEKIESFIKKCNLYLQNQEDSSIRALLTTIETAMVLDHEDDREKAHRMVEPLVQKLLKQKDWFYWDALVGQLLIIRLNSKDACKLAQKVCETFDYYQGMFPAKASKVRTLLNLSCALKLNKDLLDAEIYIDQAIQESEYLKERYLYYDALYRKAEVLMIKGLNADAIRLKYESERGLQELREYAILQDNKADWDILLQQLEKEKQT